MDLTVAERSKLSALIYTIREQRVMLDRDLAELYQVETRILNQAVRRHAERFDDFTFQLTKEETQVLRTQNPDANISAKSRSYPYVFNEYGVLTLSNVLNTDLAISINRKIIKIFVEIRNQVAVGSQVQTLKEKILKIEAEQETVRLAIDSVELSQTVDNKILSDKMVKLSQKVHRMMQLLNEFQDTHLLIKRPEDDIQKG